MPTIKRRRRGQRARITNGMIEVLRFGTVLIFRDDPNFENEEHERNVWHAMRHVLMERYTAPGKRPWAFYKFDLGVKKPMRRHWQEIAILEQHGLLSAEEKLAIESIHLELSGDQRNLYNFNSVEAILLARGGIRRLGGQEDLRFELLWLKDMEEQFQFAAGWHERRARPEVAGKYQRLVALVKEAREMLLSRAAQSGIEIPTHRREDEGARNGNCNRRFTSSTRD